MSSARRSNPELDELIDQITVDCCNDAAELTAFEVAFEQACLPCHGSVVGEDVEVLAISTVANRHELIATCHRKGGHYEIALLDIELKADLGTSNLLAGISARGAFNKLTWQDGDPFITPSTY